MLARSAGPSARVGTPAEAAELLKGIAATVAKEAAEVDDDVASERLLYLVADVLDAHDTLLELDEAG